MVTIKDISMKKLWTSSVYDGVKTVTVQIYRSKNYVNMRKRERSSKYSKEM